MRNRLSGKRRFRRLYAEGRRARRDGVSVVAAPSGAPGVMSRVGLAVRTRPHGAVARNRIKRRLRAALSESAPPGGFDIVVQADPSSLGLPFEELVSAVRGALEGAGVRAKEDT